MTTRHRGSAFRALLPHLPRNLAIFDGHCLLCQARVRYVLERNFNYLSIPSYLLGYTQDAGLVRHRIYFTSFDSLEGNKLRRLFFPAPILPKRPPSAGAPALNLPLPNDLVILFVEKVASRNASLLRRVGGHRAHEDRNAALFAPAPPVSALSSSLFTASFSFWGANNTKGRDDDHIDDVTLTHPESTDLLISTNFAAMCRIGMHLDRMWLRAVFRILYYTIPSRLGDAWFERAVSKRRKLIWGTSQEDAVKVPAMIEGMKERRWSWRTQQIF